MKIRVIPQLFLILFCFSVFTACAQPAPIPGDPDSRYREGRASRDGIGKFYMGREISHVMGYRGAGWLERPDREKEEATDKLVEALPLPSNAVVADIGAGTGYFTFQIAQRVPNGTVYAVDIQQEMLDIMAARMQDMGITNVQLVKGDEQTPNLPEGVLDLVLFVDVYHELAYPYEMITNLIKSLKVGGKLILVEYRGEDPRVPIKPLHKMTEKQARKEMEAAGLVWVETLDLLPQQHFMVFERIENNQG